MNAAPPAGIRAVVLDTNIALDLFVFADEAAQPLRAALAAGTAAWLATVAMRDELARVLAYAHIAPRLDLHALSADAVLARFDAQARRVEPAPKAPLTCKDADDQGFIDLAVAHGAWLLSKDRAVLALRRRLARLGVAAGPRWDALDAIPAGGSHACRPMP